jgi:hypothetical protein
MSGVLGKVAGFFVAPAAEPAAFAPPRPRLAVAGVLAAEADLQIAAGAVAGTLRREAGSSVALVCVWRGNDDHAPPTVAPAAPAAGRLAGKLARRGFAARACGTVCLIDLPAEPEAAASAFREAVAAAEAPAVLALGRRDPGLDPLLATTDRLVLALPERAETAFADLALDGLGRLGPPTTLAALPAGLLARQAARLGLAGRSPAAREAGAAVLQESLS